MPEYPKMIVHVYICACHAHMHALHMHMQIQNICMCTCVFYMCLTNCECVGVLRVVYSARPRRCAILVVHVGAPLVYFPFAFANNKISKNTFL